MPVNENPSGINQPAGGQVEEQSEDTVKYETYKKVLGEKKRRDEELAEAKKQLDALLAEKKQKEEEKLKADGEIKKLLELRETELQETKKRLAENEETFRQARKLDAFVKGLSGQVDLEKYGVLISDKLEAVVIDPNTGSPDPASVQAVCKEFESKFPEILKRGTGVKMPNAAAQSNGSLTHEEWLKLPLKEMKARLRDVVKSS